ncbi:IroE protein [Hypoxylon sp. FL1284]|nr:IroE protein [Hypoxylon sp. FL1284]
MMSKLSVPSDIGSSEEWSLKNKRGEEYLIQIGFPRNWADYTPAPGESGVPVLYLTDGNSVFRTALDALHRRLSLDEPTFATGVVVAIGYPIPARSEKVYDTPRRCRDFTPASSPGAGETEGGADEFLDFIEDSVKPLVRRRLTETNSGVRGVGKGALFGHSFGGLFCLHALFTRPDAFHCFIASSPSIWWNGCFVETEEAAFREGGAGAQDRKNKPSLMMFAGGVEDSPPRRRGEGDEEYKNRRRDHQGWLMTTNARNMGRRLETSGCFENFSCHIYEGEDHGTVVACSISRGLTTFLEDWPFVL